MSNRMSILLVLLAAMALVACERALLRPNPDTDARSILEEYLTLVEEKYAMLAPKGVDMAFLKDSLLNTVDGELSDAELFSRLAVVTNRLRDGHSSLLEGGDNGMEATFDLLKGFPRGVDRGILENNYIGRAVNPGIKQLDGDEFGVRAVWGTLPQAPDIGYLWLPTWAEEIDDSDIETIFRDLNGTTALIVDQRLNQGGDPNLAVKFAAYFIDEPLYVGFERFKTGPGPSDFTNSEITMQPANSDFRYLKPVAVLTDRNVYSAGLTFTYSLSPLDRVTFIGQRSGGGSGGVGDGYLANGWYWSLSVTEFVDHQGRYLDDGLDPDIPVALDLNDPSRDEVIERAILELQ